MLNATYHEHLVAAVRIFLVRFQNRGVVDTQAPPARKNAL